MFGKIHFVFALGIALSIGAHAARAAVPTCAEEFRLGLGNRQAYGSFPANTPENASAMADLGIKWWGFRVYLMDHGTTEQQIKEFHNSIVDPVLRSSYLILPSGITAASLYENFNTEAFTRASQEGQLIDAKDLPDGTQTFEIVPASRLLTDFDLKAWKSHADSTERWSGVPFESAITQSPFPFLAAGSWVAPVFEGQLYAQTILENSGSGTTLRKLMNRWNRIATLFKLGFNTDFEQFLGSVANQYRRSLGSATHNVQSSDAAQQAERLRHSAGTGHSFEIRRRETGELIAGVLIHQDGNWLSLKTPVYPSTAETDKISFQITNPKTRLSETVTLDRVDLGKIAVLLLVEWAKRQGIETVDVGMVTPFTRSIKGQYYPRERAQEASQPYRKATNPVSLQGEIQELKFPELANP